MNESLTDYLFGLTSKRLVIKKLAHIAIEGFHFALQSFALNGVRENCFGGCISFLKPSTCVLFS